MGGQIYNVRVNLALRVRGHNVKSVAFGRCPFLKKGRLVYLLELAPSENPVIVYRVCCRRHTNTTIPVFPK